MLITFYTCCLGKTLKSAIMHFVEQALNWTLKFEIRANVFEICQLFRTNAEQNFLTATSRISVVGTHNFRMCNVKLS